jgi:chorismate-pyruvate lyase
MQPRKSELSALVSLFYNDPAALGEMTPIAASEMPEAYRQMLAHQEHMTVAMEARHESIVDVDILETTVAGNTYSRKILLRRQRDRAVVQFGILRVNLSLLSEAVRKEIEQQMRPLGRILVRHNVMRSVHLDQLWRVVPGDDLRNIFECKASDVTYGRTAAIDLSGHRAVDVLEIVVPER